MGKQLKIKSGHIVLANRKRPTPSTYNRANDKERDANIEKYRLKQLAKKQRKQLRKQQKISNHKKLKNMAKETHLLEYPKHAEVPRTAEFSGYTAFAERIHEDSWYEQKCAYCSEIMPKYQSVCKFCGHDKRPIEVIEKRSRNISSKVKRDVWRRDYGKCVECGSQERLEYDHIIPFSKGGSNTARNIQILCEKCNRKKHNKIE